MTDWGGIYGGAAMKGAAPSDLFDGPSHQAANFDEGSDATGPGANASVNQASYQWGGDPNGANAQAGHYAAQAAKWSDHANSWDSGSTSALRGQMGLLTSLQGQGGPSIANAQAQQSRDAAMRAGLAGGTAQGAQVMPMLGQVQQQAGAQQAADFQRRDQLYGTTLGQARQSDINEVGFDAKQNAEMEKFYAQKGFDVRQAQLMASMANSKQNVQNWENYQANQLATQDANYRRQVAANQLQQQYISQTAGAVGSALTAYGNSAGRDDG